MAEALPSFVARRQPEWQELEALLDRHARRQLKLSDLAQLDRLYRKASADLAVAQRVFVGTDVHRFLNQLCVRGYATLYRRKPHRLQALGAFYRDQFPRLARENLRFILGAAGLLALGIVIGALTVALAPNGAKLLLNDSLRGFIERGELWTDKALDLLSPSELAVDIFINNLRVALSAFALGVTAGLGSIAILISNGINVGALLTACAQAGLAPDILTFMSAHGPVELSIIAITGGAGLKIAAAMIIPTEEPRGSRVKAHALEAVQLVLGAAPFLVGIGIVEGFVSPGPLFPWWLKLALGISTGVGFWVYLLRSSDDFQVGRNA